ncbi:MAG: SDR family oxidoreductase [Bacteroidetes bacterium]|nr:SDR family oxidoreductase [Bacteroidota bacterium]
MKTKIALVTGGSRGLGKDMALSLAGKGNDVVLTYLTQKDEAEKVVAEIRQKGQKSVAIQLDMSDLNSYDNFINEVSSSLKKIWNTGKFDFLVNNAGIGATIPIGEATEDQFDHLLNIHFKGVYFLTQKMLPMMYDGGVIINLSSGTTRFSFPGYSIYASMKGAIEILTKYLAKELGERRIRANVVAPGAIETDFNNAGLKNSPQRKAYIASQTPLGRVGQADDIGSVVAFLCSEDAKWINGQRIEVSGGINL